MNANARCEWVSPLKDITTTRGEAIQKCEVKFSFADDEGVNNSLIFPLFGDRAVRCSRDLRAGECYSISFGLRTHRTKAGAEFNDVFVKSICKDEKRID